MQIWFIYKSVNSKYFASHFLDRLHAGHHVPARCQRDNTHKPHLINLYMFPSVLNIISNQVSYKVCGPIMNTSNFIETLSHWVIPEIDSSSKQL